MNPEEGDLRPQLLDRFALCVEIQGVSNPDLRVDIIKRREAFDNYPVAFSQEYQAEQDKLRERIQAARQLLPQVTIRDELLIKISELCQQACVAGHRGDVVL